MELTRNRTALFGERLLLFRCRFSVWLKQVNHTEHAFHVLPLPGEVLCVTQMWTTQFPSSPSLPSTWGAKPRHVSTSFCLQWHHLWGDTHYLNKSNDCSVNLYFSYFWYPVTRSIFLKTTLNLLSNQNPLSILTGDWNVLSRQSFQAKTSQP